MSERRCPTCNQPIRRDWLNLNKRGRVERAFAAASEQTGALGGGKGKEKKAKGAQAKGGYARAAALSPEERSEQARKAALKRWSKP